MKEGSMSVPTTQLASFGATTLFPDRVVQRYAKTFRSALLSQVDFCATEFITYPILMILGIVAVLAGLWLHFQGSSTDMRNAGYGALALGIIFLIAYALTRRNVITIRAGEGTIQEAVRGKGMDVAVAFVQAVEAEKKGYDGHGPAVQAPVAPQAVQA
jgi:hypothetical protein